MKRREFITLLGGDGCGVAARRTRAAYWRTTDWRISSHR